MGTGLCCNELPPTQRRTARTELPGSRSESPVIRDPSADWDARPVAVTRKSTIDSDAARSERMNSGVADPSFNPSLSPDRIETPIAAAERGEKRAAAELDR